MGRVRIDMPLLFISLGLTVTSPFLKRRDVFTGTPCRFGRNASSF